MEADRIAGPKKHTMVIFILLTFLAYLAIDFAVYWLGTVDRANFKDITKHHLLMLPVYLIANILLTIGFLKALSGYNPMLIFGISILIWTVSLIVVSVILYKTQLNVLTFAGLAVLITGAVIINHSLQQPS